MGEMGDGWKTLGLWDHIKCPSLGIIKENLPNFCHIPFNSKCTQTPDNQDKKGQTGV